MTRTALVSCALAVAGSCAPSRDAKPDPATAPAAASVAATPPDDARRVRPEATPPPARPRTAPDGATAAPEPVVHIAALTATGALTTRQATTLVEHNLPRWRRCYMAALAEDPALCGSLRVDLTRTRHGGRTHAAPQMNGLDSATLSSCLDLTLRAPTPALAAPGTTVHLTLVFAPSVDRIASCGPPGAAAALPAPSTRCTADTDCAAVYDRYVAHGACCRSCTTVAVAARETAAWTQACAALGGEGCPVKRCVPLAPVACVDGTCQVVDAHAR